MTADERGQRVLDLIDTVINAHDADTIKQFT